MANPRRFSWSEPSTPKSGLEPKISSSFDMSNPTRGWRTRRLSDLMEGRVPETANVKRWDGAARACCSWDGLRRDPELWHRNGNCLVYLYKRGQSSRGPSFKVPFGALLEAKCHPLISRFITREVFGSSTARLRYEDFDYLHRTNPNARIELYIPPPAMANKETSLRYYIAMRNFFAWIFRRSLVGEHLGMALIWLLNTMAQLRCLGEDNMEDLMSYIDEEGYLDMRNQPVHSLAILHFAEYFQCKSLYIDAFTHCVGMSDRLFVLTEYQTLTSVTRKLIRQVKAEMDLKLAHAGVMLRNFLEDDLSEANIGLTSGGMAHLERFRSFLHAYFATRLGYYPPGSLDARNLIFEPEVYYIMRQDLDALYEYLVDKSFTTSDNVPPLAQGGICTLQTVHGFDLRNRFAPLHHPLPLLPDITPSMASRRISWLNKTDKLKPDQRLVAHSALVKATNKTGANTLKNPLVSAYRKFEEDSIFWPLKADRHEKLSQVDARKIRWILIYSVYQVVRSCTEAPAECQDTEGVNYHIALNTASLPPWREGRRPVSMKRKPDDRRQSWGLSISVPSMPIAAIPNWPTCPPSSPTGQELKPDVDYFALAHKEDKVPPITITKNNRVNSAPAIPPRVRSLNNNFRRSLQMFNSLASESTKIAMHTPRNRNSYHEIVVQGYGNGTNEVFMDNSSRETHSPPTISDDIPPLTPRQESKPSPEPLALHSPSAYSTSSTISTTNSTLSSASDASRASTVSTAPSSCTYHSAISSWPNDATKNNGNDTRPSSPLPLLHIPPQRSPNRASITSTSSSVYSLAPETANTPPPALPRKNSRRKLRGLHPCPLRINKSSPTTQLIMPEDGADGWRDIDVLPLSVVGDSSRRDGEGGGSDDLWAQFSGVGGLTEVLAGGRTSGAMRRNP